MSIGPGDRQSVLGEAVGRVSQVSPEESDAFEIGLQHAIILPQVRSGSEHNFGPERHVDAPPDNGHSKSRIRTEIPRATAAQP